MDAEVTLTSVEGEGTTVTLDLPVAPRGEAS
jgi:signal transduction histidine kinase